MQSINYQKMPMPPTKNQISEKRLGISKDQETPELSFIALFSAALA